MTQNHAVGEVPGIKTVLIPLLLLTIHFVPGVYLIAHRVLFNLI